MMAQKEVNSMQTDIISKLHIPNTKQSTNSSQNKIHRSRFVTIETFVIIWVDSTITFVNEDIQNCLDHLRCIVNSIEIFTDIDESVDYLSEVINEKVLMIISGSLGQYVTPLIHEIGQLVSIYIFCENKSKHELCTPTINKVKGVFIDIEELCDKLRVDVRDLENNLIPISIISSTSIIDHNQLDSSFMYSQLLKEILLECGSNEQVTKGHLDFVRRHYATNKIKLQLIDEFEREYSLQSPIWWYTRQCFLCPMINKALRTQDIEVILLIAFFIRDIHQDIEKLYSLTNHQERFVVYRGQGMFQSEFNKIKKSRGGLLAFNSFLSTSSDRAVSFTFADSAVQDPALTGILFKMIIDPCRVAVPFASLDNVSFFNNQEKEVLFSMHTVFEIGEIKQLEDRLFEINLTITDDNDKQLHELTQYMRKMTQGASGLDRLGSLMNAMGEFDMAEGIYNILYEIRSRDNDQKKLEGVFNQLGLVNHRKGDLESALTYYQKSLDIQLTYLSSDDSQLSSTYSNMGLAFLDHGNLDKALKYLKYALEIDLRAPQAEEINIALRHNNIGSVLQGQEKYLQALESYLHALEIFLVRLPAHHPWVAATYNNIALICDEIGDKSSALQYLEKALQIQERSLPPSHPSLAITHSNLSCLLNDLHEIPKAIEHAKKALNISRHCFGSNHPKVQDYQQGLNIIRGRMEPKDVVAHASELSSSSNSSNASTCSLVDLFVDSIFS